MSGKFEAFLVDGSQRNFADVIISRRVTGKTCAVASYGFGVVQVNRLVSAFRQVLLVADESHSQLNTKAYDTVVRMDRKLKYFTFRPTKIHAKLALIDDEVIIFTSANLSANRRVESYLVGQASEVAGIEAIKNLLSNPDEVFVSRVDEDLLCLDLDLDIDALLAITDEVV